MHLVVSLAALVQLAVLILAQAIMVLKVLLTKVFCKETKSTPPGKEQVFSLRCFFHTVASALPKQSMHKHLANKGCGILSWGL